MRTKIISPLVSHISCANNHHQMLLGVASNAAESTRASLILQPLPQRMVPPVALTVAVDLAAILVTAAALVMVKPLMMRVGGMVLVVGMVLVGVILALVNVIATAVVVLKVSVG